MEFKIIKTYSSALLFAAEAGNYDIVELLLASQKFDINIKMVLFTKI